MKQVRIDFAAPSLARTLFRTGPAGWTLMMLALLLCLVAAAAGWQLLAQDQAHQVRLATARLKAKVPPAVPAASFQPLVSTAQAAAVNAAVLQLNLPWRGLHDAIGAATPASVALLALEPDARKYSIKITAEARSSDQMIAYISQLKEQQLFKAVALAQHEINEQDPNRPIRFQLVATWRPQ